MSHDSIMELLERAAEWMDIIGDGLQVEIIEGLIKYEDWEELRVVLQSFTETER